MENEWTRWRVRPVAMVPPGLDQGAAGQYFSVAGFEVTLWRVVMAGRLSTFGSSRCAPLTIHPINPDLGRR